MLKRHKNIEKISYLNNKRKRKSEKLPDWSNISELTISWLALQPISMSAWKLFTGEGESMMKGEPREDTDLTENGMVCEPKLRGYIP